MSPLRQYEAARADLADALERDIDPAWSGGAAATAWLKTARANYRAAVVRLVLAALAWLVVASVALVIVWALIVLFAAAAPDPSITDIQLPTL